MEPRGTPWNSVEPRGTSVEPQILLLSDQQAKYSPLENNSCWSSREFLKVGKECVEQQVHQPFLLIIGMCRCQYARRAKLHCKLLNRGLSRARHAAAHCVRSNGKHYWLVQHFGIRFNVVLSIDRGLACSSLSFMSLQNKFWQFPYSTATAVCY